MTVLNWIKCISHAFHRGNGHWSGFGRAGEARYLPPTSLDGRGGTAGTGEEESSNLAGRAALASGRLRHAYLHCKKLLLTSWAFSSRGRGQMFPNQLEPQCLLWTRQGWKQQPQWKANDSSSPPGETTDPSEVKSVLRIHCSPKEAALLRHSAENTRCLA